MAKKVSKWFRIGVEGDTCDNRVIDGNDIQEMAAGFDQRVYGCRINLEHIKGLFPNGDFKRLGDVVELKAETIDDDTILNGKWALFAKMTPTDELVAMVKASQKVYTSMEIRPNFANTGKCYLVGLAVTDDPASLGTEYLEFCSRAKTNPLAGKKAEPGDVFSVATEVLLEFEELPDSLLTNLTDRVKGMFSRKQVSDDMRFSDVHDAVTVIAEQVQTNGDSAETRFSQLEQEVAGLKGEVTAGQEQLSELQTTLDNTENLSQQRRPKASGGNGEDSLLTNC